MADPRLPVGFSPEPSTANRLQYRIMRKGSRYNILGPTGRIFSKYKSASVAGPRWEELTHSPWPYDSTAYERGHRLWELGLIDHAQIGKRTIRLIKAQEQGNKPQPEAGASKRETVTRKPAKPKIQIVIPSPALALPAPSFDLAEQQCLMQALRRNPVLLFNADVQQALRREVEYSRPHARWVAHLLKLLARYERRQRSRRSKPANSAAILEKHTAWQAQRMKVVAATG